MPAPLPLDRSHAGDLALALRLADLADGIGLSRFGALDLQVDTKPDLTPVSDADRAIEQALRAAIAENRPDDAVLGEEFGATDAIRTVDAVDAGASARRWVIDPIDATKNFVRGVPVWATLIALMDADVVTVGVVSAPALGQRWWAARGQGSWMQRHGYEPRRNGVSKVATLGDASVSYSSLAGWNSRADGFNAIAHTAWRTRAYGDFWSHVLVAEGAVDVSMEPDVSLWDVAPLVVIVEEAGGRMTGVDGSPGPNAGSILCTNGLLHDGVLATLNG